MGTLSDLFNSVLSPISNETDPTKGAALVGYDDTTVKSTLDSLNAQLDKALTITTVAASSVGQTTFAIPGGYPINLIDVYMIGVHLINGVDYTATDGLNIILSTDEAEKITVGMQMSVQAFGSFVVANAIQTTTLGAAGGATLVGYGSQTVAQVIDPDLQSAAATLTGSEEQTIKQGGVFVKTTPMSTAQFTLQTYQGFLQSGSGATIRTILSKLFDISVNAADFGAKTDGTDSTAAIQAAVNAVSILGGVVKFNAGYFHISGLITVQSNVVIQGAGLGATSIVGTNLAAGILYLNSNCAVYDITLGYAGTPTAGSCILAAGSNIICERFIVNNAYNGIECIGGAQFFGKFQVFNYVNIGVYVHDTNDVYFEQFIINAQTATNGAAGGVRLENKTEAIVFTDGDILLGNYSLTTDAASYTLGNRPAYCNFTNVFFDSASNACANLNNIVETEFVSCWFSGGRTDSGFAGCAVNTSDSLKFTNTRFFNCGAQGVIVNNTAVRTHFVNCSAESNSVTTGAGNSNGFHFLPGTQHFLVSGCIAHNGLYTGTQGYGIFIDSGCDFYRVVHNDLSNNATGPMIDGSNATATNKVVAGNVGYITHTKGTGTIAIGQTVTQITHGLSVTPGANDIVLMPTSNPGSSGVASLWVTDITATTLQIVSDVAVTSVALGVAWSARTGD